MKPRKPRIRKRRLNWKYNQSKNIYDPYYRVTYFCDGKKISKEIKLDWEGDEQLLDRLYWECASGTNAKQQTKSNHTWAAIIAAWRADIREQSRLSDGTIKSYNRIMELILVKNADKQVKHLTRKDLRAIHESLASTPRKADWVIQIVSKLWNYAKSKQEWDLGSNPAEKFDLYGPQNPFQPWPDWMVNKIDQAPHNVRVLCGILLNTGQRPGAAVLTRHDDFVGDDVSIVDQKTGTTFEIHCPDGLRILKDSVPKRGDYLLPKNLKEPLGYDLIEKEFRQWRGTMGENAKSYTLHGLRKLAIIQLAESGASDAEIQAITNQSIETVAYYRKMANRKILSKNAFGRNKNRTQGRCGR